MLGTDVPSGNVANGLTSMRTRMRLSDAEIARVEYDYPAAVPKTEVLRAGSWQHGPALTGFVRFDLYFTRCLSVFGGFGMGSGGMRLLFCSRHRREQA